MKAPNKTDNQAALHFGETYHVYNKAISHDKLFITSNDYHYFLKKLTRYILPVADIIAYCLIPNHFHILLEIKDEDQITKPMSKKKFEDKTEYILQSFSNFFNSYSKSFNNIHQRSGRLFLYPFKRKQVDDEDYYASLINYIHRNPVHHGLSKSYSNWDYSSYNEYLNNGLSLINREKGLALFGSVDGFVRFHEENKIAPGMEEYYFE